MEEEEEYLRSVSSWSSLLYKVLRKEDEKESGLQGFNDASLFLHTISEDSKQRLANPTRAGKIVNQLEVMASNLKSLTAAVKEQDGTDVGNEEEDEYDTPTDTLVGWGEQLFGDGLTILEDKHIIRSIVCNGQRALYVTDAGDVFCFGDNGTGMPASHISQETMTPKVIGELVLERVLLGRSVVSVACGQNHSVAVTQGGLLWSWGWGEHGRLGHGDELDQPAPKLCEALKHVHVRAVACGGAHTVAIVSPSRVFSWGLGRSGRLGLNDKQERNFSLPQLVDVDNNMQMLSDATQALLGIDLDSSSVTARDEPVVGVACGWAFTLLLGANGTIRAFGAGLGGQCGIIPVENQYAPCEIHSLSGLNIVQVSCGYHHALAVSADGHIYSWGTGEEGQLGHGPSVTVAHEPMRLHVQGQFRTAAVSAGQFHSVCTSHTGKLWGWGNNYHGAVDEATKGDIHDYKMWKPRPIDISFQIPNENHKLKNSTVKLVTAGAHFTLCVLSHRGNTDSPNDTDEAHELPSQRPSTWSTSSSPILINNEESLLNGDFFSQAKEKRAVAALRSQTNSGSFCGGRIAFWKGDRYVSRIGVLSSSGRIEMYNQLNASRPTEVIDIHGHDVEIRCRANVLEASRSKPGYEYLLLLRLKMNSNVEAVVWGNELSKHAITDRNQAPRLGTQEGGDPLVTTGRREAWKVAIGNQLRITPELYLIYKERATRQEGIGLDIRRTLPTLLLFGRRGEPLYEQLREVLEVYQCYRPDVGYVQGMSYVAAMICLHVPNSRYESFVCLANLLATHHLFDFYRLGQAYDRVQGYYKVLDLILEKSSKKLWRHLNALHVMEEVHVTCFQWLQTMFVRRLPLETATLLWDAFLCRRDSTVMMRACIAMLLCRKQNILAANSQEEVLILLRGQPRVEEFMKKTFSDVQVPTIARERLRQMFDFYPA